jgi:hypothetical protein
LTHISSKDAAYIVFFGIHAALCPPKFVQLGCERRVES